MATDLFKKYSSTAPTDKEEVKQPIDLILASKNKKSSAIDAEMSLIKSTKESMTTPEAWLADIGANLSKFMPNMRRLIKGSDDPEAIAELKEIEKMQDNLRVSFPSASFAGDVVLPSITTGATVGLKAVGGLLAGMTESAGMSSSKQSPRENATIAAAIPAALKGTQLGVSALGRGFEASALKLEDVLSASPDQQAGRAISRYMDDAGLTIDEVLSARTKLGPGATLADVAEMQGASQAAALSSSGRTYMKAFEGRQLGQQTRLFDKMSELTNKMPEDFFGDFKNMVQARSDLASPLYNEAKTQAVQMGDDIAPMIRRLKASGALSEASKLAKISGREMKDGLIIDDLHNAKLAIDDMISGAVSKNQGNRASTLKKLKDDLLGVMDKSSPEYGEARRLFAGESEIINAAELGENLFNPKIMGRKVGFEQVSEEIEKYGADQFQAFQGGVVKQVSGMLEKVPDSADSARRLWSKPSVRKSLALAFDTPEQFDDFLGYLKKETQFTDTLRSLYQGSQTQQRSAAQGAFKTTDLGVKDIAKKAFSGEISPEGMQEITKIMFDTNVSDDYIAGVLQRAGLVTAGTGSKKIANIRNSWDKIWAGFDRRFSTASKAAASAKLAPVIQGDQEVQD